MRPHTHIIISAASSAALYTVLRSKAVAVGCFLTGVFIDIDHLLDYFMTYRKFSSLGIMYRRLSENRLHAFYLILHSYEFIFLLWVYVLRWNPNAWLIGIAWGATTHLICDQIAMSKISNSGVYLLSYRVIHNFKIQRMLRAGTYGEIEDD